MNDPLTSFRRWLTGVSCLPFVFFLALVVLIKMPLTGSLWLDECITFWVSSGTVSDVLDRALSFQGQSPFYYLAIWAIRHIAGASELSLRLLSVLALVGSAALLHRIARHMAGRETAALALVFFISHDAAQRAISSRPYACALFFALLATRFVQRLPELRRAQFTLGYALSMALAGYCHYLFLGIALLHVAMVLAMPKAESRAALWRLIQGGALGAAFLFPSFEQVVSLGSRKNELFFAALPSAETLLAILFPALVTLSVALAFMLTGVMFFKKSGQELSWHSPLAQKGAFACVLWWYVAAPVALFALAYLAGVQLFVNRYMLWQTPGLALLAAVLICGIQPARARYLAIALVCFLALIREVDRKWVIEPWRDGIGSIKAENSKAPVLYFSGLVEAENPAWLGSMEYAQYLRAPFFTYGFPGGTVYVLPSQIERPELRAYFEDIIAPTIAAQADFFFIGLHQKPFAGAGTQMVDEYYSRIFGELGWKREALFEEGLVRASRFRR